MDGTKRLWMAMMRESIRRCAPPPPRCRLCGRALSQTFLFTSRVVERCACGSESRDHAETWDRMAPCGKPQERSGAVSSHPGSAGMRDTRNITGRI